MSEGESEDDWDNLFYQYQPPTAPLQRAMINSDLCFEPSAPMDSMKRIRDPQHNAATEDVCRAILGLPPQIDPNLSAQGGGHGLGQKGVLSKRSLACKGS